LYTLCYSTSSTSNRNRNNNWVNWVLEGEHLHARVRRPNRDHTTRNIERPFCRSDLTKYQPPRHGHGHSHNIPIIMKSILSLLVVAAGLLGSSTAASEPYPAAALEMRDGYKALTYVACYSSAGSLTYNDDWTYQTQGYCQQQCVSLTGGTTYPILATSNSTQCWCGDAEPPAADKVDDSKCNSICAGYAPDMCTESLIEHLLGTRLT